MNNRLLKDVISFQKKEATEYEIYKRLASATKNPYNRKILYKISEDEKRHYSILKKYTKKELNASKFVIFFYYFIAKIFGLTFGIKLMEKGEGESQINYRELKRNFKEVEKIEKDEHNHERDLINLLNEEKLSYVGSIVLGLNDALVELTGALAGFTFALQNSKIIATAGLVTGIAAAMSMSVSEYLSKKSEGAKNPFKSAIYTGIAYIVTVALLITPYLVIPNIYLSLIVSLAVAIVIIFCFTYYISVAKEYKFWRRFLEMAILSLSVAAISFVIGIVIRAIIG